MPRQTKRWMATGAGPAAAVAGLYDAALFLTAAIHCCKIALPRGMAWSVCSRRCTPT